jgi:hypothetical protein
VVDVTSLSSARPGLWAGASADWQGLGTDMGQAGGQISSDVAGMISSDAWTGAAATAARGCVNAAAGAFAAAQGEINAVSDVLEGLSQAMAISQQTLEEAQDLALRNGLTIGGDGRVSVSFLPPELPGATPVSELLDPVVSQVQELVSDALQRATEADQMAARELRTLASHAGRSNPDVAFGYNAHPGADGLTASRLELEMIYGSIPAGPPSLVSKWWAGLTLAEQKMLMEAAPGKLGTLAGIPASVQAELRGSNGVDRVAIVSYALDNTFNTSIDTPGLDNCTDFVSHALQAGGLVEVGNPLDRTHSNAWFNDPVPDLPRTWTRSYSWAGAPNLYHFLTQNGSQAVPYPQAQPGDIAFYTNNSGVYHSAVVTAVVNGQVFYSQHTPGEQNASWASRQFMPDNDNPGNPSQIVIVRPGINVTAHPDPQPGPSPAP